MAIFTGIRQNLFLGYIQVFQHKLRRIEVSTSFRQFFLMLNRIMQPMEWSNWNARFLGDRVRVVVNALILLFLLRYITDLNKTKSPANPGSE